MRARSSHLCRNHRTFWQVCVSALLIGLILYNPFLALSNPTDGLAYQMMARHRATVGASELEHFSPVQTEIGQPQATIGETPCEPVVAGKECAARVIQQEVVRRQPELIASIWFRPPPAL
jgi:hypothetical protein